MLYYSFITQNEVSLKTQCQSNFVFLRFWVTKYSRRALYVKFSHLDVSVQRMKSERKYSKHDELLISEPSGDANNLLLIHQGHLSARQHCNAGGNITKYIIWQSTERIQCGSKAHDLVFKLKLGIYFGALLVYLSSDFV